MLSFYTFIIGLLLGAIAIILYFKYKEKKIYNLQLEADHLIKEANIKIERKKYEMITSAKKEINKKKAALESEIRKERQEIQKIQNKLQKKEDTLEHRETLIDELRKELQHKERVLARREEKVINDELKLKKEYENLTAKLEKLSGLSQEEAKQILLDSLEKDVKLEKQKWLAKINEEFNITAKDKAIDILVTAMQRYLADQVTMHSSSVIHLPNEDMKGRIIGKEGRNIKALEMATGIEFVIGDTPEIITISGFNPVRREVAKRALTKLIQDGRINPTRIEEVVQSCKENVDNIIVEQGQQAVLEFGLTGVHPELIKLIGSLYFRTSYTQNNLIHSKEVASFAKIIAAELGLDSQLAARCGLMHDIGKAVSAEVDGPHAIIGADLAKQYGEDSVVVNAIASHHNEVPPKTVYALITHIADAISASRPGARKETLSTYIKRLEQLEDLATQFEGVKKAYALQAGREIRVIVNESKLSDKEATVLARDIANKVEDEVNFPGQIKVNVIREKRIVQYAK